MQDSDKNRISVRACTLDDFEKMGAAEVFNKEYKNGGNESNMLCPDDWSALNVQNSEGQDLEWFYLQFHTCGQKPGCIDTPDAVMQYSNYFN